MPQLKLILLFILFIIIESWSQFDVFPVHPDFDLVELRRSSFDINVGGMDWLSDGRMAIADFGKDIEDGDWSGGVGKGRVFILDNLESENKDQIEITEIATGLWQPLGLTVVDDKIYVLVKDKIHVYAANSQGDYVELPGEAMTGWAPDRRLEDPNIPVWGQWAMGMVYKEGYFYFNLSVGWSWYQGNAGGPAPEASSEKASVVRVSRETGKFEVVASGFRSHNSIGFGPDKEIFVADNDGKWVPTEGLSHIKQGHFYGHEGTLGVSDFTFGDGPYQPPAVWLPHDEMAKSPTTILFIDEGIFTGQMYMADQRFGQIMRLNLEMVDGEYQGAVFRFSGGFESGPNRILFDPNGQDIYVGGLGGIDPGRDCGNWCWHGMRYGFQKLKRKSTSEVAFEMLAVRSRIDGMEVEFTKPVDPSTVTTSTVLTTHQGYQLMEAYGSGKLPSEPLNLESIEFSQDNKIAFLKISNLEVNRVVKLDFQGAIRSADGDRILHEETFYTLNAISETKAFDITGCMLENYQEYNPDVTVHDERFCITVGTSQKLIERGKLISHMSPAGKLTVSVPIKGDIEIVLVNAMGSAVIEKPGKGFQSIQMNQYRLKPGMYVLKAIGAGKTIHKKLVIR